MATTSWIEMDFHDLHDNIQKIKYIKSQIESRLDGIMLEAALILEAEVVRLITDYELIDTGALRASIHSFVRSQFGYVEGVVGTNMHYAKFVEYGTGRRGAANPHPALPDWYQYGEVPGIRAYKYMWNAWQNKKKPIMNHVEKEVRKLVA